MGVMETISHFFPCFGKGWCSIIATTCSVPSLSESVCLQMIMWFVPATICLPQYRTDYCSAFATPFHAPLLQRSMADCHTLTI